MANPPGNHQQEGNHAPYSFNGVHMNNGKPIPEAWCPGLKHNPGISMDWTLEEQAILENGLQQLSLEPSITRYAKIALQLHNKTVRDVALRCKWMTKKENSKRRKEDLNLARKIKDKRERVYPSGNHTHFAAQPNLPPDSTPMNPVDVNDGFSYRAIGGLTGELLEQNAQALNRISENLAAFQLQENICLFRQTHDNILRIMNALNEMPDAMKQMPRLQVKMDDELVNSLFPPPPHPMQQGSSF